MGDRRLSDWEILWKFDNGTTSYLGNELWEVRHRLDPPGKFHEYSIQIGDDYVQVVGLTDDFKAVLIVQDRVANGLSLEAIAGGIKEGQTPEEAAIAEFGEESEWHANEVFYLGRHVPQTDRIVSATEGNLGAKCCHMFLALGLIPSPQKLESIEKIHSVTLPWSVAVEAAVEGLSVSPFNLPIEDTGSRLLLILADRKLKERGIIT